MSKIYYFALLSILLFEAKDVNAQQILFLRSNFSDSAHLARTMPALARTVMTGYRKKPVSDELVKLSLVAGDYASVPKLIQEARLTIFDDSIAAKDYDFNEELYALIKSGHHDVAYSFPLYFERLYEALPVACKSYLERTLQAPQVPLPDGKGLTDQLTAKQALKLCLDYAQYQVSAALTKLEHATATRMEKENYSIDDSVRLQLPDGGTIALNVIRNKKDQRAKPVVLMYNIYSSENFTAGKRAVVYGYVGVTANTRGKRLSPDATEPFEHDAKDAYYIIDWISKQPWCDGQVAMYGGSYLGFSQWAAAKYLHPALKTIVPQVAVAPGIDYPSAHGIYMAYMDRWIHYVTNNKMTDQADFNDDKKWNKLYADWYASGRSFRSLDTNAIFQRWLDHPTYDHYWQQMTPQKEEFARINIPILSTTGYYDDDQLGALYYFRQYQHWNKHNDYYLVIGPYSHLGAQGLPARTLSGYTIDRVANISFYELIFCWFGHILKGEPMPAILKDRINFEVMGKNEWRHVASLSQMSNDTLTLDIRKANAPYIIYNPHLKDRRYPRFDDNPIINDRLPGTRDKLVFKSAPVSNTCAISGAVRASLLVSVNKKDMDITLDLFEETPDGKYFFLNSNMQRASYADEGRSRRLLTPGRPTRIELNDNFTTCRQLQKGSRIVVVLGVLKDAAWQINYGTGKNVSDETIADAGAPMKIKWFPQSTIKIPILK